MKPLAPVMKTRMGSAADGARIEIGKASVPVGDDGWCCWPTEAERGIVVAQPAIRRRCIELAHVVMQDGVRRRSQPGIGASGGDVQAAAILRRDFGGDPL